MYSEVKEQCLCLAATVLEAPCLSTPSSQPHTWGYPDRSHAIKTETKLPNLWLQQKTAVSPPSRHVSFPAVFSLPDVETNVLIWGKFYNCQRWLLYFFQKHGFIFRKEKIKKDCIMVKWKFTSGRAGSTHVGCSFLLQKRGMDSSSNISLIMLPGGRSFL